MVSKELFPVMHLLSSLLRALLTLTSPTPQQEYPTKVFFCILLLPSCSVRSPQGTAHLPRLLAVRKDCPFKDLESADPSSSAPKIQRQLSTGRDGVVWHYV